MEFIANESPTIMRWALLEGVFKRDAILNSTCTVKPSTAAAKSFYKPDPLDNTIKEAIIGIVMYGPVI